MLFQLNFYPNCIDKLFNNLGDMLNSVKLSTATAGAKKEKKKTAVNNAEPYDFKTDFKL